MDIVAIEQMVERARNAEAAVHAAYGKYGPSHHAMQLCLAWNTIYEPSLRRVITTVSRSWNVLRLGYGVFCWDSFFSAWLLGLDNPELARNCLRETFREMIDGQFVPNIATGSGRCSRDRSQPPVGGICVLAIHEMHPDIIFLRSLWPALLAWNRWWHEMRRNATGLLSWGSNPFTPVIGDAAEFIQPNTLAGAAHESGLDNTPMYEGVPFDKKRHLMALSDVGLVSLYISDCQALAKLADILDLSVESKELQTRATGYTDGLQNLWNPDAGIFQNRRTDTGAFQPRISPTSFYPMLAGAASPEQVEQMITRYLLNPDEFWGEWVMSSVGRSDPAYGDQQYLRGPIWVPLNFLVYLGLKRADCGVAARLLAQRSHEMFMRNWDTQRGVFENYSAITGGPTNSQFCEPLYAWSGLLALMNMMEAGFVPVPTLFRKRQPGDSIGSEAAPV